MSNKKSASPKLRFAEFANRGEVSFKNGDALFEPISDKDHNCDLPVLAITQEQGAIPREMIDYHVFVTDKSLESYKKVEVGDFIISLRSFQGGIEYSSYQGICSPAYIILRKKENVVNEYYKHYFKSKRFIQDLNRNLEGIRDGKMVSFEQFSQILIPQPDTDEQQRIADCLESLDDLIDTEKNKLNTLQKQKKGLLTKLIPKHGESVPEWRFNANLNEGKWETTTLGFIGEFIRGLTYSSNDVVKNGMLVLRSGNIQNHQILFDDLVFVDKKTADEFQLKKNDVVICMSNGSKKLVGKTAEYVGNYDKPITVGAFCSIFRSENPLAKYFFQTESYNKYISNKIEGGNINNLKNSDLETFEISIPKNPCELEKIVETLLSIDNLILLQTERIKMLKKQKHGLIQNLFPSFEEVSKQT